jgi:hypothetical protein
MNPEPSPLLHLLPLSLYFIGKVGGEVFIISPGGTSIL